MRQTINVSYSRDRLVGFLGEANFTKPLAQTMQLRLEITQKKLSTKETTCKSGYNTGCRAN